MKNQLQTPRQPRLQVTFYMVAFLLLAFGQLNAQVSQSFEEDVVDNDAMELPKGPFSMNDTFKGNSTASFIPFPNSVAGRLLSMKMKGREENSYQVPFIQTADETGSRVMLVLNNFSNSSSDTKSYPLRNYFEVKREASRASIYK